MIDALAGSGPVQIAYHVPDPEAAAEHYARVFGWGPFYVMRNIPLEYARYRGRDAVFDHTSAYGQAGNLMIEFITQHGDDASALRDVYAQHETGIHHVAFFVPELAAAVAEFKGQGYDMALEARTTTGVDFVMVDTVGKLGHMLELYEQRDDLEKFYSYIRHKAQDWDGNDPVRVIET